MRVVRVSGTIRKSEEEAIRRARADILRAMRQERGQTEISGAPQGGGALDLTFGELAMAEGCPEIEDGESGRGDDDGDDDDDDVEI